MRPPSHDRADDAVRQKGDQNDKDKSEDEFPKIADRRHLLQQIAERKPDRRADGRADQRSSAADHGLDDELPRRVQSEGIRRHVALENSQQRPAAAGKNCGKHEHGQLVGGNVVAERRGALRILLNRRQHRADRRQHDKARKYEAEKIEPGNELVARPRTGESIVESGDLDAWRRNPRQSVLAAGQIRQRRILQKIRQFAERQGDHRKINADPTQRQKPDEHAERRRRRYTDRHGKPNIVQGAAGQQIGGDEAAGAVERRLAERQKAGAAEQQIEAETENSPDQDAREQIDRAEPAIKDERQKQERDHHGYFRQPTLQPAPVDSAHYARPMVPNRPRGRTIKTSVITA